MGFEEEDKRELFQRLAETEKQTSLNNQRLSQAEKRICHLSKQANIMNSTIHHNQIEVMDKLEEARKDVYRVIGWIIGTGLVVAGIVVAAAGLMT